MASFLDRVRYVLFGDTSVAQKNVQQTTRTLRKQASSFDRDIARIDFRINGLKLKIGKMTPDEWYRAHGTEYNTLMKNRAALEKQMGNTHKLVSTVQAAGVAIAMKHTVEEVVPAIKNLQYFSDPEEAKAAVDDIKGAKGALDGNVRALGDVLNGSWDEEGQSEQDIDYAQSLLQETSGVTLSTTAATPQQHVFASGPAPAPPHLDDLEKRLAALASPH
jgi:hypothetical protein